MKHYFAADGNYGDAEGLFIVDTSAWDEDDWDEVESFGDLSRMDAVRESIEKHDSPYTEANYLR
jgi:hypothetical protein